MTETIWDRICSYEPIVRAGSVLVFSLGILTLISVPYVEPGTPEYAIMTYNVLLISVLLVAILVFRFKCK